MPEDLRTLQAWFATLVRAPDSALAAAQRAPAVELVSPARALSGAVVTPGAKLDAIGRVQVYTRAYALRLAGAIAEDYPGLRAVLGAESFDALLDRYVQAHPSRHPNLIFAGRDLPEFVAADATLPQRAFAADVARVEWAMTEAFHAPEFTPADLSCLATMDAEAAERLRLRPNPSLRLLALGHPVVAFLDALRTDPAPAVPVPAASWVAVYRHGEGTFRIAVPRFVYDALLALGAGASLADALTDADPAEIGGWFQRWSAHGLFDSVTS